MIWKKRINKLQESGLNIYYMRFRDLPSTSVNLGVYTIFMLVNIIFMMTVYITITIMQEYETANELILNFVQTYMSLSTVVFALVIFDVVISLWRYISYYWKLNKFLKSKGV